MRQTHAWCDGCGENSAIDGAGRCLWCGGPTRTNRGGWRRPDRAATSLLTEPQVYALHRAHMEGASIRELGRRVWERIGSASERSAANVICDAFRRHGLPARSRSEATAKANAARRAPGSPGTADRAAYKRWSREQAGGRRLCAGVRLGYPRKGEPCQRWAMRGSDYCLQHDPNRRAEVVATAAAARATTQEGTR